jgi:hypothetical protein
MEDDVGREPAGEGARAMSRERELLRDLAELFEECVTDDEVTPSYPMWIDRIRALLDEPQGEPIPSCFDCGGERVAVDLGTHKVAYCPKCARSSDCLNEPQGELQANSKPEQNLELEPQYVWRVTRVGSDEQHVFLEEPFARSIAASPLVSTTLERAQIGPWEVVS